ncbi:MAG: YtxH domain-containing protein [Bacteroidales bacterium]
MKNGVNVLLGFAAGAVAGAIAGVLLAPDKGSKTRKDISEKVKSVSDGISETFSKKVGEINEGVNEAVDKMHAKAGEVEEKVKDKDARLSKKRK